ncbi:NlpC/P60 family protein [Fructilactobacillus vespulae]|uniref:NlpC/P60 family protein n=1 Tax=Fructilactobacillus vespulae TaxID=1249630 RepID=UPI0039B67718
MKNEKVHYKMFKAGKKWMFAGIATVMVAGGFISTSNPVQADAISNGTKYVGTPYSYGGFDCSAFVQQAFAEDGISLPRTSGAQYSATQRIDESQAQAGDLVFFGVGGSDHVGIYLGNGQMLDSQLNGVTNNDSISYFGGPVSYGRVNGTATSTPVAQAPVSAASEQAGQQSEATSDYSAPAQESTGSVASTDYTAESASDNSQQAVSAAADDAQSDAVATDVQSQSSVSSDDVATDAPAQDVTSSAAVAPASEASNATSTKTYTLSEGQNVRENGSLNAKVTHQLAAGSVVNYDKTMVADGYTWLHDTENDSWIADLSSVQAGGVFVPTTTRNVRSSASLNGNVTGQITNYDAIVFDGTVQADGHTWLHYKNFNGADRYVSDFK